MAKRVAVNRHQPTQSLAATILHTLLAGLEKPRFLKEKNRFLGLLKFFQVFKRFFSDFLNDNIDRHEGRSPETTGD